MLEKLILHRYVKNDLKNGVIAGEQHRDTQTRRHTTVLQTAHWCAAEQRLGTAGLDYINPKHLLTTAQSFISQGIISPKKSVDVKEVQTVTTKNSMSLIRASGSLFIRIAGFSGASAVAMGAYGSHAFYNKPDIPSELKDVYRIANYYHFMHSLALLAVPLTKRPALVGSLLVTGMLIFCGTCYSYALTGNKSYAQFTPYGGTLLIAAWLSMMF